MHKKVPTFCGLEGGRGLWCHSLLRGMVLFAPKTAVVGLRHLTHGVNTSTCQQAKFESYNEVNILI